jgi:peptide/nickel transport system ATP-binding protein
MSMGSQREPLLKVTDLRTFFRTQDGLSRAVDGISFEINAGETFALVGESGCGKSVTALSIIQLVQQPAGFIASGSIEYKGRNILSLPEMEKRTLRGNEISMVFQEPMTSLNPVLTVGSQIVETIRQHQPIGRRQARARALEMLDLVRIPEPAQRFDDYPHQLSGGMRQRVMIAIALACRPGLLIADEPTTALDVTIQQQILELIGELREQLGTAVLLITHDLGVVAENADRVAVMYAGRIVEEADRRTLFTSPAHPYTTKLLESLPRLERRQHKLQTIEGHVPEATRYTDDACRFADRCHRVMAACHNSTPPLRTLESGHTAACLLYDDGALADTGLKTTSPTAGGSQESQPTAAVADEQETLIEARNVQMWFPIRKGVLRRTVGHVRAVDGVDLNLKKGRTLALVGESGSGKTTLGRALIQLLRPTAGTVRFQQTELTALGRSDLKPIRKKLQIVFQDPYGSLNPRMMVGEIIAEGMETHGIGANRNERRERVVALMDRVGLDGSMISRYPHEFSGGQRQRLGIARCLAVDPEFIVCDEATSALDVSVQAQIINLLEELQQEMGLSYLLITHDLSVVSHMAHEVAVMYLGRIVETGTRDEIFDAPRHPYTQALLSAIPVVDAESGHKSIRLGGDVPSPSNPPPGCHFHPRCEQRLPICDSTYPDQRPFTQTHSGRCHLYE